MEWLLVEAKSYVEELESRCGAKEHGGLPLIQATLARTKAALEVQAANDWLSPYYQYANRLAMLHMMMRNGEPARLLFIYFTGDKVPGKRCPATEEGWDAPLESQDRHLGLPAQHQLSDRIHKLFLPANGPTRLPATR
jgi:hypothetical protein